MSVGSARFLVRSRGDWNVTWCGHIWRQQPEQLACVRARAGYRPDGRQHSLLEWLLWETEQTHGRIRRYTSPDEQAFFPNDLPPLVLPPMEYPKVRARPPGAGTVTGWLLGVLSHHKQLLTGIIG